MEKIDSENSDVKTGNRRKIRSKSPLIVDLGRLTLNSLNSQQDIELRFLKRAVIF